MMLLCVFLASCKSHQSVSGVNFQALAHAGLRLGVDIEEHDNFNLYLTAAEWVGVPYSYGGNTKGGVDCSGLSCQIIKQVYGVKLHRRSIEQYEQDVRDRHSRNELKEGDLLFFKTSKSRQVNHVGVYLKQNKFIHASTSRGVVVDNLNDRYWKENFAGAGNVKR